MRGEVEVSMRGLRAAMGQSYKAAHAICERLVKLKVESAAIVTLHAQAGLSSWRQLQSLHLRQLQSLHLRLCLHAMLYCTQAFPILQTHTC